MPKSCLKSSKRRKRNQKYGKGLIKNLKMRFCWRMVKKIKGKFYNVFIFCVLKMRSRRAAISFADGRGI